MGKGRSSSSKDSKRDHDKSRGRLRAKLKRGNHPERDRLRNMSFDTLRDELNRTLGVPKDCHIFFLKRYEMDSLPKTPRLKITFGNSVLLDAETWKVLQVNRFIPFSEMTHDKKDDLEFVVETLYQHTLARGEVTTNGAVQGLENWGEMRSAGFRAGSDKGRKMGVTALNAKTSRKEELIHQDEERMLDLPLINEILAEWMSSLCLRAFESNRDLALKYEVPSFSDATWSKSPNANIFASSVVVTRDGFFNKPHSDRDVTAYTYGIFVRIDRETGKLHWVQASDYLGDIVGTHFILDQYHVELALDGCDGVVESVWASDEIHHTCRSTTLDEGLTAIEPRDSPITRFGSSLQINEALLNRIEGLLKMKEGKTEAEWEVYKKKVVKCYKQEVDIKLSKLV